MGNERCAGFRTSGYWKGWPCGAVAKYSWQGKHYCKNHLPLPVEPQAMTAKLQETIGEAK